MKRIIDGLKSKLAKTKNGFVAKIAETIKLRTKIDQDLLDDIEDILLEADIGVDVCSFIIEKLSDKIRLNRIQDPSRVMILLKEIIDNILDSDHDELFNAEIYSPYVMFFVGVNGVGKTTTIGKLAHQYVQQGKKVMMIAADTFRAAAIEQLSIWSQRSGAIIQKHQSGADPSAVIFDGLTSAINKKIDIVMIDTAGRLHNKVNLMNELAKMKRTIKKVIPSAPHKSILVIDSSTGQNAIIQAKIFDSITDIDCIALTKLDGTAKGGIVIGIKHELGIPVELIGLGEKIEDLQYFNSTDYIEALFE